MPNEDLERVRREAAEAAEKDAAEKKARAKKARTKKRKIEQATAAPGETRDVDIPDGMDA